MKYLTAEELKNRNCDEAHDILHSCTGKSVRDNFAFDVFDKYYSKFFNTKDQRVLDLGPASGGFDKQITEEGYSNIYGVDIDDYRPEENKKYFVDFKIADLSWEKLPWSDNYFKVVTAWCVLPHLENPFFSAREVSRVLDKDGIFVMTTPFLTSKGSKKYFMKHDDFGSYRASNNHIVPFTKGLVQKTILKYFDLIAIEYHFRSKVFSQGFIRGNFRKLIWKIAKTNPKWKKEIAKRWAYNIFYILKKK